MQDVTNPVSLHLLLFYCSVQDMKLDEKLFSQYYGTWAVSTPGREIPHLQPFQTNAGKTNLPVEWILWIRTPKRDVACEQL